MKNKRIEPVVIIGCGPAGASAAIQLYRHGIKSVVFEKEVPGGMISNANLIENYLGFPDGISGPEIAELIKGHLIENQIEIISEQVISLDYNSEYFEVISENYEILSKKVVIASGTIPNVPDNLNISNDCKKYIFYDIETLLKKFNFPSKAELSPDRTLIKTVAVIGGGDAAFDYAANLSKRGIKAVIINRSKTAKCLPILKERVFNSQDIIYHENTVVLKINCKNEKDINDGNLKLFFLKGDEKNCNESDKNTYFLNCDCVIFATGRTPNTSFISENVKKNLKEFMIKKHLYMIGDAANGLFRQLGISVGDGLKCAMDIFHNINDK